MKKMYMLDGVCHVAFALPTDGGRMQLQTLREKCGQYFHNRSRIKEVLQAYPSKIEFGAIYEKGFNMPKKIIQKHDIEEMRI
jgi:hypothetical protein